MADFGHVPAILETPELELSAYYDPLPDRASAFAEKFGQGRPFSDIEAFFDQRLDIVVVASPAPAHFGNVIEASRRRVHVLCEKPIAMDEGEAELMISSMTRSGKKFFVGFCYRFSSVAEQMCRWYREGTIGQVKHIRMVYDWNLHGQYVELPSGEWGENPAYRGRMIEGGPLVDCGVHQIDLARWWTGSEISRWQAAGTWSTTYTAPDHVTLQMQHENGVLTTVDVSYGYTHTAKDSRSIFTYEMIGTGGVARYDREGYILEARTGRETIRTPGASEKNFAGMYRSLVEELQGGANLMPTPRDALVATDVAHSATDALISNRAKDGRLFAAST